MNTSSTLLSVDDQYESFIAALEEVKNNSPRIRKFFQPREAIVSGSGYRRVEDISLNGELNIGGSDFLVSYNVAGAVRNGGNIFYIPFSLKDLSTGAARDDALIWSPSREEAGLLLSFDDAYFDAWKENFDLFDSYGTKLTFFVQGSLAPDGDAAAVPLSPLVTENTIAAFCTEALSRGHNLGFHTVNHLDLTKVTPEVFNSETFEAADALIKNGFPLSAFAYPFGFSQPWMHEALSPLFPITRGYGSNIRFYDTRISNDGYIVSTAIDNIIYPDRVKFETDIFKILLAAKFTGNIIVPFTTHDISDDADWGITLQRLEYVFKTANELKLHYYTYSDLQVLFLSPQ